jgi:hypothetical protein
MKYGEAVAKIQDALPLWVLAGGEYLVAGLLLLLGIVLLSSLSALMFGTPSLRQVLARKQVVRQVDNGSDTDQPNS